MSVAAVPLQQQQMRLMMGLFVVSEAIFFAVLIMAFLVYHGEIEPTASNVLSMERAGFATGVVLLSSATVEWMRRAFALGATRAFRTALLASIALGAGFIAIEVAELGGLLAMGYDPNSGFFGTTFTTLTGFHLLHVVFAWLAFGVLLIGSTLGKLRQAHTPAVEAVAVLWQFVNVVWVVILFVVYLGVVI